jgi:hypothetical protein
MERGAADEIAAAWSRVDRLEGSDQRASWLVEFLVDVVPEPEVWAIARAPLIVDAELRALVAFEVVVLAERAVYRVAETSDGLDANGFRCIETLLEQVVVSVVQLPLRPGEQGTSPERSWIVKVGQLALRPSDGEQVAELGRRVVAARPWPPL